MKKVLFSVMLICLVASMVAAGTWAYFSDYEHSEDNYFAAGDLDLKVDGEDDPNVLTYFELECVAPCDEGLVEINLENTGCVDGVADIHFTVWEDDDVDFPEPEDDVSPPNDDNDDGTADGDLCENLDMSVTADLDGDGTYETLVAEGKMCAAGADGCNGTAPGIACTNWIIGNLLAYSSIDIMIEWSVDCEVGNIIMTDTCKFDIEFSLNQKVGEVDIVPTDLIQDPTATVCEPYMVDVVVHNNGTMPGNGWVVVALDDQECRTYVEDLAPCDSTTITCEFHLDEPGSYLVTAGDLECPVEAQLPPQLVVTGIQQDEMYQVCEEALISIDVHNTGDQPGSGMVLVVVALDPETIIAGPWFVAVGPVDPCETVKVDVEPIHINEAWRPGAAFAAGFNPDGSDFFACPAAFLNPPAFEVVGIQQPAGAQPCEQVDIAVDIHNTGDKPGVATITWWVEDESGAPIVDQAVVTTESIPPCVETKIDVGTIHIDETWMGQTVYVIAQASVGAQFPCPINVLGGSCIEVTGIQQPEMIEVCDILEVGIDIHNAGGKTGECFVEWWLTDEGGAPLVPPVEGFIDPVGPLAPCETEKVAVYIGHVGTDIPPMPLIVVNAVGCCGDPVACPIMVVEAPYSATYYSDPATSYMVLASSLGGAELDPLDPPSVTPMQLMFDVDYSGKQTGSVYRDLTIPYTSWSMVPYSAAESVPTLNYVTITVDWDGSADGAGELYLEGGDVDYVSNIIDPAGMDDWYQQITWGDGSDDPAGSAWMRFDLLATVWSNFVGPTDPCDDTTWGTGVLPVPMELFMTTAEAQGHVQDFAEAQRPAIALDCHWVPDATYSPTVPLVGAPFADTGGLLPYVGTDGTVVGATGGVDYVVFGMLEVDFQVEFYWDLTTTPWVDPCGP